MEQKELFDRVLLLGEEEMREPIAVFERFFSDYRLHECRYILWSMVETCLTTENTEYSDADGRANLLLNYRNLERILEAGILLLREHRAGDQRGREGGGEKRARETGGEKRVSETGGEKRGSETGGEKRVSETGGEKRVRDTGEGKN